MSILYYYFSVLREDNVDQSPLYDSNYNNNRYASYQEAAQAGKAYVKWNNEAPAPGQSYLSYTVWAANSDGLSTKAVPEEGFPIWVLALIAIGIVALVLFLVFKGRK